MTLPDSTALFTHFYTRYRDAFNALDGAAVSSFYCLPCVFSQSQVPQAFADYAALLANNTKLVEFYKTDGFERADFTLGAVSWFGPRHVVVDVAWCITRQGKAPAVFNTGYNLRLFGQNSDAPDWRIWAVTVYEEAALLPISPEG